MNQNFVNQNLVNQDVLKNFTSQLEPMVDAVQALNKLSLTHLEKMVNVQMGNLQAYADMGLANLKAGAEVRDVEDLKNYATRQGELAQTVGGRLVEDGKNLAELNAQFGNDVLDLVRGQAGQFSKQAA